MLDGHDPLASVSRVAKRHGLRVQALEPRRSLATFADGAHVVTTFAVSHCACDWGTSEYDAMAALARDLLLATDVRRVRIGIWMISGDVASADSHRPLHLREIDTDALAEIDWKADVALDVRRAPHPPYPARPLRKLSLGMA